MSSQEIYQNPIQWLRLSPRSHNSLARAHITTVGQVLEISEEELLKIRNFGQKPLDELRIKLAERGIPSPWEGEPKSDDEEDF